MNFQNIFFIISLLIFSCLSIEEDLIDLTDYDYPKNSSSSPIIIPILSSNDLHGGIFPQVYSDSKKQKFSKGGGNYLYSYKKILEEEWGNKLIWLDAGDQFQGTMECMLSDGLIMKDFYNKAGLQGIALGNHEFDYGVEYLKEYIKKQKYPLIVTNMKETVSGKYISETWDNVIDHKIFEIPIITSDKEIIIKIGVIGLTTKSIPKETATDISSLTITDYVEETRKWESKLRNEYNCNAIIVVAHFGPYCNNDGDDKYILTMRNSKTPQKLCEQNDDISNYLKQLKENNITIDGVVGGHRHNVAHHWISGVPVVESSGPDYFNILYLAFKYNDKSGKYTVNADKVQIEGPVPICEKLWPDSKNCEYKYEDSSVMKKFKFHGKEIMLDPEMVQTLKYWEDIIISKLNINLIETEENMDNNFITEETLLTNLINDIGRIVTNSDICFYNPTGLRTRWYKGPLSEIDIFRMLPFNNTWVNFEMTGEEVFHLIQDINQKSLYPFSGVIQTLTYKNSLYYLKGLLIYDGFEERPLDMKKTYKICTNDFLANGGSRMGPVRTWYKELRNKKDFGIVRGLVTKFLKEMKGTIREDKFIDKNYPKINIEK